MTKKNDWFWFELITPDQQAAAKFYSQVVGWTVAPYSMGEGSAAYLVANQDGRGVAGFMVRPPEMPAGIPPFWSGYIYSDDVDGTVAAVRQAGGEVIREPFDVPTVGRIAVLGDPEGGLFNVMTPSPQGAEGPPEFGRSKRGHVSWGELHSDDPEKNFAWYQSLFGWKSADAIDMGPNGTYQTFTTNDAPATGGSCGKMGASMPTGWLFYFHVDGIDAAVTRIQEAGGTVFMGPHEVPGGSWIVMGNDPQGALFALHSQAR